MPLILPKREGIEIALNSFRIVCHDRPFESRCLTSLRFCCAIKMPTASEARDPNAYRDSSSRLLGSRAFDLTSTS